MTILTILGGAKRNGNTATILGWMEEALQSAGHEIARINLDGLNIHGCRGCYACMESHDSPGCVIDDDAHQVFDAMMVSDAIILSTPLYMWSYAGQLKCLLDRGLCLATGYGESDHSSLIEGKPGALLVSAGGGIANNADAIQLSYPRWADYVKLAKGDVWIFENCTRPEQLGDDKRQRARELAERLVT
ncbi:flavodoxin family protein [Candidatus Bipolaricaulota bacterium]